MEGKKLKIIGVVQARMGSKRLPNKLLLPIGDKLEIEWIFERLKKAKELERVVMATTDRPDDDVLVEIAQKHGVDCFRGSESDVAGRLYGTILKFDADAIFRVTADSPLIDPQTVDMAVREYRQRYPAIRFLNAALPFTFPEGFGQEIVSREALEYADNNLTTLAEKETFVIFLTNHPELFPRHNLQYKKDASNFRMTLDYPEDMEVVQKIYAHFLAQRKEDFNLDDMVAYLEAHPEVVSLNQHRIDREKYPFAFGEAAIKKAI